MYRLLLAAVFLVLGAITVALIASVEGHYWLIPFILLMNIISSWLIIRFIVLRSILFPYSSNLIVSMMTKQLNQKYCQELGKLMVCVKATVKVYMNQNEYKGRSFNNYRDASRNMVRIIEFFEKFAPANRELID